MQSFAVYIHIPFCLQKCPYCDFNTYAVTSVPEREYIDALLCEIDFRAVLPEWRHRTVRSIYFGGGTPSLISPAGIGKVIAGIVQHFPIDERIEISMEANPGSVSEGSLRGFHEAGVNRVSFGAQSFSASTLRRLGRIHQPEQIEAAVVSARRAGIGNINLDLMYGAPEQTIDDVRADLAAAIKLDPEHLSAYGLTIEKGTPFFISYKKGILKLPKEESVVEMMAEVNGTLELCGLKRYEISNFAKSGYEARHNLAYWRGVDYLGLGAGAHSFCRQAVITAADGAPRTVRRRWSNFGLPARYNSECAAHGHAESWSEEPSLKDAMFEFFFLGLRTIEGVNCQKFYDLFGYEIPSIYPARLEILQDQGLIEFFDGRLALTERGLMLADSVIEEFVEPEIAIKERTPDVVAPSPLVEEASTFRMAVHD